MLTIHCCIFSLCSFYVAPMHLFLFTVSSVAVRPPQNHGRLDGHGNQAWHGGPGGRAAKTATAAAIRAGTYGDMKLIV